MRLCPGRRVESHFPDCDPGAIPPFGNLYDMDVYLSPKLEGCEKITFNAGSHEMAIRMSFQDYRQLVKARAIKCSHRPDQS